ncbi:Peptidase family M49 [Rosistilla carotiformis]|uniref:Peptidase family M49 n=1 Tax=Rosistilla carotiformis TaxID=2528017 RepID=A0A518JSA9_9BACT|nr:peptidase M49 [Rosistilla carotiformis]QDV68420.1 Peptidase family M49 [Rosistilla carotiformis]
MNRIWLPLIGCLLSATLAAADESPQANDPETRKYLLDRVDDVAIAQLYVDGFEQLPLNDKLLIYHLTQASIAGRDIFIDQKYKHSLLLRDLIEETLTHADGIDPEVLAEIRRYAKLFWVNNGPHSALTSQKNILRCSPEAFTAAVQTAVDNGADIPLAEGQDLAGLLSSLQAVLFDPKFDAFVTQKSPEDGEDILTASANNLYDGVVSSDLEGFEEKYPLNSRLVKKADGTLEEQVYRAGFDHVIPGGMYAPELTEVCKHLEAAIPYATPKMARALGLLIHYYHTGEAVDFREYNIAWVDDKDSPVDTINGFIEVYMDARGQKGSWESVVYFNDPAKMAMITAFSENAQWFEDQMPFDPRFRKPEVKGISAKAIQVVIETGDSGPVTPIGINLPNAGDIREQYGSKSVSLSNVVEAYERASSKSARAEFCLNEEEYRRSAKWKSLTLALEVNMHEVIGHASGRNADSLKVDPSIAIKEYYSALEEGRADLVALYFIGNPKLVELGLVDNAEDLREIQRTAYEEYTRNAMTQLRRLPTSTTIEEDHMRNRQMIVHWLAANTAAIDVIEKDGKTYYQVIDVDGWHDGVGRLLKEVQRIKSEGDRAAAERLMEDYAIKINTKLRDEVLQRYEALDQPAYTGFVMPQLTLVSDPQGTPIDVAIDYPQDMEAQMLRWSGRVK